MYKNDQKWPRQQFNCKKDKNKRRNTITTTRCLNIKSNKLWIWVNLHVLGINLEEPGSVFDVFVMQAKVAERTIQFQGVLWDSAITSLSSSFRWWHRPLSCAKGKANEMQWKYTVMSVWSIDPICLIVAMVEPHKLCLQSDDSSHLDWMVTPKAPFKGYESQGFCFQNCLSPICIVDKCRII